MKTLSELSRSRGIRVPRNLNGNDAAPEKTDGRLLARGDLERTLRENNVTGEKAAALFQALKEIEENADLLLYSEALRDRAPLGLMTADSDEYETPVPSCLHGFARDAYAFLYALSCVPVGMAELKKRGVPEEYYLDIPARVIREHLRQYVQTGDITFSDYPWDMNFYCCAIVFLKRFYFIPCRCEYPNVFVNRRTGETLALWPGKSRVRPDGQLDGVNGVYDPEAFETDFVQTKDAWTGFPVHPSGVVLNQRLTLSKEDWASALKTGDLTIALHIPGGEGYTPENVRVSMLEAVAYYRRYFPDVLFQGFWSESWLYDPGLAKLLPQTSRIVSVQRQFYNYPTMEGDAQAKLEVFGDSKADISRIEPRTRLERGLIDTWRAGGRFHTTGMFVLTRDAEHMGDSPYLTAFAQRE